MLLAVGDTGEKAEDFRPCYQACCPAILLPAGQETPETLRSTHLSRCVPEGLEQGAGQGTVMNDHRVWSGQAGMGTSL